MPLTADLYENTPDHGVGAPNVAEGAESQPQPKGSNPMPKSVDHSTDIVQLDAELTPEEEFADYMKEEHPQVKKDSANWNLIKRGYDQENVIEGDSLFDLACKVWHTVTGGLSLPGWATKAGTDWRFPTSVTLISTRARVPLMNTRAACFEEGGEPRSIRTGCMDVLLKQRPIECFPLVQIARMWNNSEDGDLEFVEESSTNLTLNEAVELAHVLLLMVDVARESAKGDA
jgi:hypothetical protein